ncbi:glycosyltransferase family 25 protein [Flavobacterium xanthum]|uniref:Glycosyltransferase family 25 (LPS biosynthesis protein) n=1 Tax=Flavobacterium xanthum TaxID=69322 RepID=A0A1M6YBJ8_9FLAO|nr:glycosyltransferase family 25 protein [Flavobacterium xanthum]SHL15641.1 Glycosyltransferase family 25 (LPS biosynthesis protein) [Flavobacterium xanthum]
MKIKTFVVNLKESVDRKLFMNAQIQFFPELDVVFHEAFDARNMRKEDLIHIYDDEKAIATVNRCMVPSEIGVAKSQLGVMKQIANEFDFGLIMEDDLLISPYFSESLAEASTFINNPKPRIVLFTPVPHYSLIDSMCINKSQNRGLYKIWDDASYAACYLINKAACEVILNKYKTIFNVIDNWGYLLRETDIEIRAIVPHVVSFSKFGLAASTINFDNKRDLEIQNNVIKTSLIIRLNDKITKIYQHNKYKVVKNKRNVWYNKLDIIQSSF